MEGKLVIVARVFSNKKELAGTAGCRDPEVKHRASRQHTFPGAEGLPVLPLGSEASGPERKNSFHLRRCSGTLREKSRK